MKIKGVEIKCEGSGGYLVMQPENDGYIPVLDSAGEVEIRIKVEQGINVWGFSVDENKNITPTKNWSVGGIRKIYRKKVRIRKGEESYTLYHENHLRLLEVIDDGYFAIHEGAVVFQNGLGFLTFQRIYEGSVFQSGKGLFCPEFYGKWPQLIDFLESIYKQNGNIINNLPCFEGYNPFVKKANGINLDYGVGIVRWFNVARGLGAISTNHGDVFVHYKDIDLLSRSRLICLTAGQEVLYDKLITNTEGSFRYKVVGVVAA